jgi:hypothetical protein
MKLKKTCIFYFFNFFKNNSDFFVDFNFVSRKKWQKALDFSHFCLDFQDIICTTDERTVGQNIKLLVNR